MSTTKHITALSPTYLPARTVTRKKTATTGTSSSREGGTGINITPTKSRAHAEHTLSNPCIPLLVRYVQRVPGQCLSVAVSELKTLALHADLLLPGALSRLGRLGVPDAIAGGGNDALSQQQLEFFEQRRVLEVPRLGSMQRCGIGCGLLSTHAVKPLAPK